MRTTEYDLKIFRLLFGHRTYKIDMNSSLMKHLNRNDLFGKENITKYCFYRFHWNPDETIIDERLK